MKKTRSFLPRWQLVLTVMLLTAAGSTVRGVDSQPLLADAVKAQDQAAVRALVAEGAGVNVAHVDGMSPLHWAAFHDDVESTKLLLDKGAKVNQANRYGVQPLSIACKNGNREIVELLLNAGADPNTTQRGGETALMTAARTGRPGPVKALLAAGAEVNAHERKGQTALMWAAADGHAEVVDLLLAAGADLHAELESGFTPLLFAVREGRTAVVFRLLEAGAEINAEVRPKKRSGKGLQRGTSPLVLAIENGHFELAAALLDAGADPNDGRCGYHPLHAMTWVRKPLRGDGDPPPIGSGTLSSLDFVRTLIANGADVNARHGKYNAGNDRLDRTGATPFLLAAETGDLPLMRLLLEHGADPFLKNDDDCTPLLAAAGVGVLGNGDESAGTEEEAIEAVRLLLELGADIDAVQDNGNTAMHGAAYKSWTKMVHFLAENGADIEVWNRKNKRGWTPLMIAQGNRPGNFRPSSETIRAVSAVMRAAGVDPSQSSQ